LQPFQRHLRLDSRCSHCMNNPLALALLMGPAGNIHHPTRINIIWLSVHNTPRCHQPSAEPACLSYSYTTSCLHTFGPGGPKTPIPATPCHKKPRLNQSHPLCTPCVPLSPLQSPTTPPPHAHNTTPMPPGPPPHTNIYTHPCSEWLPQPAATQPNHSKTVWSLLPRTTP